LQPGEPVETIYFGGGTPSAIPDEYIKNILNRIKDRFPVCNQPEITLEANPDDINPEKIHNYRSMGINRISIGIQSFDNKDLKLLNRRHSAEDAERSVLLTLKGGFSNVSIDLIYGIPGLTNTRWLDNLKKIFALNICHLSAYHLTYEPGTELYYGLQKKRIKPVKEQDSIRQFELLMEQTEKAGFRQYEISNFALNDHISRHNTGYWTGKKYIGLGPSAHSYNGTERQWNITGIMTYCRKVREGEAYFEKEVLDRKTIYNEYLMTSLRTCWGLDTGKIMSDYGNNYYNELLRKTEKYLKQHKMTHIGDKIILTREGMLIADSIIRDLFVS
jgi:oxygen-independent coproporphyrinogen-3 oxidase